MKLKNVLLQMINKFDIIIFFFITIIIIKMNKFEVLSYFTAFSLLRSSGVIQCESPRPRKKANGNMKNCEWNEAVLIDIKFKFKNVTIVIILKDNYITHRVPSGGGRKIDPKYFSDGNWKSQIKEYLEELIEKLKSSN